MFHFPAQIFLFFCDLLLVAAVISLAEAESAITDFSDFRSYPVEEVAVVGLTIADPRKP